MNLGVAIHPYTHPPTKCNFTNRSVEAVITSITASSPAFESYSDKEFLSVNRYIRLILVIVLYSSNVNVNITQPYSKKREKRLREFTNHEPSLLLIVMGSNTLRMGDNMKISRPALGVHSPCVFLGLSVSFLLKTPSRHTRTN